MNNMSFQNRNICCTRLIYGTAALLSLFSVGIISLHGIYVPKLYKLHITKHDNNGRKILNGINLIKDTQLNNKYDININQKQQQQLRRRRIMYLPPAPVRPFSGRLKPSENDNNVQEEESSDTNIMESSSNNNDENIESSSDIKTQQDSDPNISFEHDVTSWSPEDYPDPWTNQILCGSAATSHLKDIPNDVNQSKELYYAETDLGMYGMTEQQKELNLRRPIFCDPNQVLDRETLRNVAIQLRTFSETFASSYDDDDVLEDVDSSSARELRGSNTYDDDDVLEGVDSSSARELRSSSSSTIEKGLYKDSVGGIFSTTHRDILRKKKKESVEDHKIEVAVALVQKINLPAILRADSYFFYSDQDDMVNDAAQYFARYVHDTWSKKLSQEQKATNGSTPTNIILIFISVEDRICYISSGTRMTTILPWWRLEHVVQDMKQDLRKNRTGEALGIAIQDITELLVEGPPTLGDRVNDFVDRFGIVILFTVFTFIFATWGECRDRRGRMFFAEKKTRLTKAEKEKARSLQREFQTKACPICLDPFQNQPIQDDEMDDEDDDDGSMNNEKTSNKKKENNMKRVDSYGIPLVGTDNQPIKLLRCGHIFDQQCWQLWVDSGQGNPWSCPVCRQDVCRPKRGSSSRATGERRRGDDQSSLFTRMFVASTSGPSMLLRPANTITLSRSNNYNTMHPNPLSLSSTRMHPMFGISSIPPIEVVGEQTPLFARAEGIEETDNDDDDDWMIT